MKKLLLFLCFLPLFITAPVTAQIPFSYIKMDWDVDALAYVGNFTDMPTYCKVAINNLVKYHKRNGLWTKLHYAIISPVTMDETQVLRELKNNTVYASGTAYVTENPATGTPAGYSFQQTFTDFINLGRTYAQLGISVTSTCIIHGEKRETTDGTLYSWGATTTASARNTLYVKSGGGAFGRMFNDATLCSVLNASGIGMYSLNRRASNYLELVKDGTILNTNATAQTASLPSVGPFFGALNTAGSASAYNGGIRDFWACYDGLTNADRLLAEQAWVNYRVDMGRSALMTKSIVLDGNSLSVRGGDRMLRKALFSMAPNNYSSNDIAVSGQTTQNMSTRYPTWGAPLYDASYSKNIYIAYELTNDLNAGSTAAQCKTHMISLIASAHATGFTTVCMCPQARNYVGNTGGLTETQWNLAIDELVQWVRAGSSGADYFIDVVNPNLWVDRSSYASDALYNTAIAAILANTVYFLSDKVHLAQLGYDLRGIDMYNSLLLIL